MLYDAIERVYALLDANVETDLAALATAKGLTLGTTVELVKRQRKETFLRLGSTTPAIGIFPATVVTQARNQGRRHSRVGVVCEYYASSADPVLVQQQAELAVEAILRTVDRLGELTDTGGVYGGGGEEGSVSVEFTDGRVAGESQAQDVYWASAAVLFDVWDEDVIS